MRIFTIYNRLTGMAQVIGRRGKQHAMILTDPDPAAIRLGRKKIINLLILGRIV